MKNLKNNRWLAGMAFLLFVFGIFFMVKAVESSKNKPLLKTYEPATFHYTDIENPGVFSDPANWQQGDSPFTCGNGENLPCEITAEDRDELEDLLDGKNNPQVMSIVNSKRN